MAYVHAAKVQLYLIKQGVKGVPKKEVNRINIGEKNAKKMSYLTRIKENTG
jgi:predicted peroxiredoxin